MLDSYLITKRSRFKVAASWTRHYTGYGNPHIQGRIPGVCIYYYLAVPPEKSCSVAPGGDPDLASGRNSFFQLLSSRLSLTHSPSPVSLSFFPTFSTLLSIANNGPGLRRMYPATPCGFPSLDPFGDPPIMPPMGVGGEHTFPHSHDATTPGCTKDKVPVVPHISLGVLPIIPQTLSPGGVSIINFICRLDQLHFFSSLLFSPLFSSSLLFRCSSISTWSSIPPSPPPSSTRSNGELRSPPSFANRDRGTPCRPRLQIISPHRAPRRRVQRPLLIDRRRVGRTRRPPPRDHRPYLRGKSADPEPCCTYQVLYCALLAMPT